MTTPPPTPAQLEPTPPISAAPAAPALPVAPPAPVEPPPPTAPAAIPPAGPAIDPFFRSMLESTGKVLGEDGTLTNAEPKPLDKPEIRVVRAQMTMGEMAAERIRLAKEAAAAPPAPAVIPPAEPVVPPVVPPPTPSNHPKLRPKPPIAPAPVVAPAPLPPPQHLAPPAPLPPPVDPDAALIASLDEDSRAELAIAEIAEQRFPELKGKKAETLSYFKKVEDYAKANPNANGEDLDAYIRANKPVWKNATQKRRAETAYYAGDEIRQGVEAVRAQLQPQLTAAENRIRQQELQPAINRQMDDLSTTISSPDILPDPGMEAIPPEVAKRISEVGYDAAVKEFKVEAPIFQGAMNAARSYLRMANGLDARDPANLLQNFVINFVQQQGQIHASKPEGETMVNGKRFLPLMQYNDAVRQNPQNAGQFYTFGEQDVKDLLAISANMQYNAELKSLEQAGFKREKRTKNAALPTPATPSPATQPVVSAPPAGSPKVKPSPPPNPAMAVPSRSENASFIDSIAPGKAKELGIA